MFVDNGQDITSLRGFSFDSLDLAFRHFALVEVARTPHGTKIKWDPAFAPDRSIYRLIDILPTLPAPYHLEFFVQGWLREIHSTPNAARVRIVQAADLIDVQPLSTFFTQPVGDSEEVFFNAIKLHPRLELQTVRFAIGDGLPILSCGKNSLMAKTFGPEWLKRSKSDRLFQFADASDLESSARAYYDVQEQGRPHFDRVMFHVYPEENEPVWLCYDRVIWPEDVGRFEAVASLCLEKRQGPVAFTT